MGDTEPTEDKRERYAVLKCREVFAPIIAGITTVPTGVAEVITFDLDELREIFDLYGRKVGDGEWRDYALEFTSQKAIFSVYRRSCENALYWIELYWIEKNARLTGKQVTYSLIAATGLVLKRGRTLSRVIAVLDRRLKLVPA
jgi:Protein of unknown function (DUF2794)